MLRRLTALLAMLAVLGLLSLLVWEVYRHHCERLIGEPGTVVILADHAALIA